MIRNLKNLNLVGNRFYSSGEIKHTTIVSNGFGGMLNILGENQHVTFNKIEYNADGDYAICKHQVENKPFEPTIVSKKVFESRLTDAQIGEIQKLRSTNSQKQLAEKFQTTPYIISRVSRGTPEKRQSLIDQFLLKNPKKIVDSEDVKKNRLQDWFQRNQQREYEQKVIKAATSFERIKRQRHSLNAHNQRIHKESYEFVQKSQISESEENQPRVFTMEEKRAKEKELSKLRRRKVTTEKDKINESNQRIKNKTERKIQREEQGNN
ncbi:hypothetical protein DDB_G0270026 [Dictyostelium discoideum AX4]|uniref:Uncharacterized protein n=1 Tax=Dictyostelium discoideum TaxID=44689 RepID=Q55CK0_DICDI|nr:hypothetical protein DDB_G0270026 [Dictyostelium discoideum AX4]EAL72363.1 hypothetical protein DDB_G0270026 [Dictyostelium discoideum AX4]|eukprot:XP_646481.1 hypothetical protein DDB_G0270026 [Dictyostelium discoideum AX4]